MLKMGLISAGKVVAAAVGSSVLLHLGGAHECSVTLGDHETTYNIPGLPYVTGASDSNCKFTWSNASNTVVGTHDNHMEPVTISRFGKLVSSKCLGDMIFSGTCMTEGTPKDYTANCTVICLPEIGKTTGMPHSQIGVILSAVIVLLLVGLLCFLCYRYKPWRWCCGQTGGFYPAVMFRKTLQADADGERGEG